ncbi:hypothetical protein C8R43DRAFT_996727 [Mycena crocata]|nr:hypothetical protein C8R43DRAFT_996727 [Mycena crocata]
MNLCASCAIPLLRVSLLPDADKYASLYDTLRSNSVPLEVSHLRHIISSSTGELGRYDDQIARLEVSLNKLKIDRSAFQKYAEGCRAVFSPIRQLPPEILCEIFALCAGPQWNSRSNTVSQEMNCILQGDLLKLSRVCAHWHTLVLDTPALWSRINLTLNHWSRASYRNRLKDSLTTSIERSAASPLHVRAGVEGCPHLVPSQPPLDLLAHYSERWQTASFKIGAPLFDCMSRVKGKIPQLRSLRIRTWGNKSSDLDLFEDAPRLTKVCFTGSISLVPKLPWKCLRYFTYCRALPKDLNGAMSLMSLCGPTTLFRLDNLDVSRHAGSLNLPSVTSDLSSLIVEMTVNADADRAHNSLAEILDCLSLPAVASLSFTAVASSPPLHWPTSAFLAFLGRSACHRALRALELEAVISEDDLLRCLSVLPELETLVVADFQNNIIVTDTLFRRLAWTDTEACVIPRLSCIICTTHLRFSDEAYVDFVRSRSRSPAKRFESTMKYFPERKIKIDVASCADLARLEREGKLRFSLCEK